MTVHLLDVNVLLALCDSRHVHHEAAHAWFRGARAKGWATCPITENGFIRIASHPKYPNSPGGPAVTAHLLATFCSDRHRHFWPDSASLLDGALFRRQDLMAHAQVTDLYLLGLAVLNKGRLATFDRGISAAVVAGGEQAIEILPA